MKRVLVHILLIFSLVQFYELCPIEYYVTDPNHSYCLEPYPNVINQPLTSSERTYILEIHNHERRVVGGTNMQKMYWNDDLAEIALHYARGCIFDHDKSSQRSVPKIPLSTGQNLAMGYENWTQAIEGWIEEKEHYAYGYPSTGIVGHYTQTIWHSAVLVGCASTLCPAYGPYTMPWPFYVCNYITGQLNSNFHNPYEQGVAESSLHDCQGKVCLYNGTLDLNTCECQCTTYATGSQCERLNCSILPPCFYFSSASCIAVNVPLECPQLCGLCDRYDVLKQVYGENNLLPNTPTVTITTTVKTIKAKANGRKLKKKLRNRNKNNVTNVLNTTTTTTIATKNNSSHLSFYIYYIILSPLLKTMIDYK